MIATLRQWRDQWLGRGDAACTVPVFDGPLSPNQALEKADILYRAKDPWDMASDGQCVWVADGQDIVRIEEDGKASHVLQANGRISALCVLGDGLAYAVEGQSIHVHGGQYHGRQCSKAGGRPFVCVNGLSADGEHLFVSEGSAEHGPFDWQRDLMTQQASGRVLSFDLHTDDTRVVADGLHHAFGAVAHGTAVWVSESWRHRVVAVGAGDRPAPLLEQLPGYPSRIAPASDGGWWVSVFACRTQLVEFVLRERAYREEMMRTMPPDLWVAPQTRPSQTFMEPLQGGGIKQMGVLKPWAPPRSYGLVVKLDAQGHPTHSLHSRVDGHHHGIVSVVEHGQRLLALSAGSGCVLSLPLESVA